MEEFKDSKESAINIMRSISNSIENNTASIEISTPSGIQKVYFYVHEKDDINDAMKEELLYEVERENPTRKIVHFFELGNELLGKLEYLNNVKKNIIIK